MFTLSTFHLSSINTAHYAGLLTDGTPTATSEDDVVQYSDTLPTTQKTLPSGATFVLREDPVPPSPVAKGVLL